jgi:hypothetical protein
MNQLMEDGKSMRAASRIMEQECEGKWKANTLLELFSRFTMSINVDAYRTQGTGQNEWF